MKTLFETIRKFQKEINRLKNEKIHLNDTQKRKKIDTQIHFYESEISRYRVYTDTWLDSQDSNDRLVARCYYYNATSWEAAVSQCRYQINCADAFRKRIERALKNANWC